MVHWTGFVSESAVEKTRVRLLPSFMLTIMMILIQNNIATISSKLDSHNFLHGMGVGGECVHIFNIDDIQC